MRQTVISRKVGARMMTNPQPSHVSLVKAGANQQAFHAIRSAPINTEDDMKISRSKSATVAAAAIPSGMGAMRFDFDAETFKTEADVTGWLDDGGYVDYTVTKTDTGFSVSADAADFVPGSVKKIAGAIPGVTVYVGEFTPEVIAARAAEAETADADEPAEPQGDVTAKSDEPGQQVSEEPAAPSATDEPVQPVATLGEDIGEVIEREDVVLRQRGMYEIESLGYTVNQLAWLVYDAEYTDMPEETVAKIKGAASMLLEAFVELSDVYAETLKEFFAAQKAAMDAIAAKDAEPQEPAASEPVEPSAPEPEPVTKSDEPAPAGGLDAETIAALVGKVVSDQLAPVASSVKEVAAQVAAVQEEVNSTKSALDTRVGALERQGQTRKGADHVDPPEQQPAKRTDAGNNILRAMGSRHAE